MSAIASVVIPAHDEQAVIARCLRTLLAGAEPGEIEVVVVANGCGDQTAEVARIEAPSATVLELETASKVLALNAGDAATSCFPRAYLDADVEMSAESLRAVVAALGAGQLCAAPSMELNLDGRPWYIRAFFQAFAELPYLADDLVGNGVYVLSEEGRARFDEFPDITADDLFIRNLFAAGERTAVAEATFRVHPPTTFRGLLAIRERSYRGNAEYVERGFTSRAEPTRNRARMLSVLRRRPLGMAVFALVNLLAQLRLRLRRSDVRWERDESARR